MRRTAGNATAVTLAIAVVCGLVGGCGSRPATERSTTTGHVLPAPIRVVPDHLPVGWYTLVAWKGAVAGEDAYLQSLYTTRGARAPAILVGKAYQDDQIPFVDETTSAVDVDGLDAGKLFHVNGYTVVRWGGFDDAPPFLVARGLSDADVARAARRADVTARPPTIPADALPEGLTLTASAPLMPAQRAYAQQEIGFVGNRGQRISMFVYSLDQPAALIDVFWNEVMVSEGDGQARVSAVRRIDDAVVLVQAFRPEDRSPEIRAAVSAIADAARRADESDWNALQKSIFDVPATLLVPDCAQRDAAVLGGRADDVRWAVALPGAMTSRSPVCLTYVRPGRDDLGSPIGHTDLLQPSATSPGATIQILDSIDESSGDEHLQLMGGVVPAATTRVEIRGPSGSIVDTSLGETPVDPDRRFFGALLTNLPARGGSVRLVAFDAADREVGRFEARFGP